LTARVASGPPREGVAAREGVGEDVGVTRTGTGETSADCAPADGGTIAVAVARGGVRGVRGDGVVGRLWEAAEGGGNGERLRRPIEAGVGESDCTDGETVRCTVGATADGRGEGAGTLRCVRCGRS
jgi:hypothetical protein